MEGATQKIARAIKCKARRNSEEDLMAKRIRKRMYGVMQERVGMIAGTIAYSRRAAIRHFLGGDYPPQEWERFKSNGYRTVLADVRVINCDNV